MNPVNLEDQLKQKREYYATAIKLIDALIELKENSIPGETAFMNGNVNGNPPPAIKGTFTSKDFKTDESGKKLKLRERILRVLAVKGPSTSRDIVLLTSETARGEMTAMFKEKLVTREGDQKTGYIYSLKTPAKK